MTQVQRISRRVFAGATLCLFTAGSSEPILEQPARVSPQRPLVCVFLRGAADGLSLVVPYADDDYRRARPHIAIAAPGQSGGALALDARFGLHPALAPLLDAYEHGELAVIHAVGSPHPTRSHFEAQDYMETAAPGRSRSEGWLSRALEALPSPGGTGVRALALGHGTPLALRGQRSVLATPRLGAFALRAPPRERHVLEGAFAQMYGAHGPSSTVFDPALDSGREALELSPRVRSLGAKQRGPSSVEYPHESAALGDVAALIHADLGLQVAWLDVGGWDTHQEQGNGTSGRLERLLAPWAAGLAAFRRDLGARFADVLVLVMTEFGRTLHENGTGGTDHGHGSVMFLLGGGVRGGSVYGRWPGLATDQLWEGRDLAVTTDFRDVYAEVCRSHWGIAELGQILPSYTPAPALGLLRKPA